MLTECSRRSKKYPAEELAAESRSRHITVAADMIFSWSKNLSGVSAFTDLIRILLTWWYQIAIVHYVQALSDVSWEEIQSSGQSDNPRLFSVRKLVEVCAYNMERIRIEWVNMWVIIGEHFNQVCTRFWNSGPINPMPLGLLPQQYPRQQFCPRCPTTTSYAVLGEGRAAKL
jgi:Sec7-like guanine-nucleotide exchange factor